MVRNELLFTEKLPNKVCDGELKEDVQYQKRDTLKDGVLVFPSLNEGCFTIVTFTLTLTMLRSALNLNVFS